MMKMNTMLIINKQKLKDMLCFFFSSDIFFNLHSVEKSITYNSTALNIFFLNINESQSLI